MKYLFLLLFLPACGSGEPAPISLGTPGSDIVGDHVYFQPQLVEGVNTPKRENPEELR